jgi:hypothetical protein
MCKMRAAEGKKENLLFFLYHPTLWCTYKKGEETNRRRREEKF